MRLADKVHFTWHTLTAQGFRSLMLWLALVIGVVAVNLLGLIGDSARHYVLDQFSILGKQTLIILPGRKETTGGLPPITGAATRLLTLEDADALGRVPGVKRVAPLLPGNTSAKVGSRQRDILVVGSASTLAPILGLTLERGDFLPRVPFDQGRSVAVLGQALKQHLFGNQAALGQWIRAGGYRYRVVGVLTDTGQSLGLDLDEVMFVPVASAMTQFDQQGLFRIFAQASSPGQLLPTKERIRHTLTTRHGSEDFTLLVQDALLTTFGDLLTVLSLAIAAIGAISLVVAGILIMNVTLIAVAQRQQEIGLLKALGATSGEVLRLFLAEAALVAVAGTAAGLALSHAVAWVARQALPEYLTGIPLWAQLASAGTALLTALLFAWWPARSAAALDPVQALRGQA